jgi:hypothetical protein
LQELILPNIAFIGGGGEIAYWLQLQKVFEKITVPYPMLVVRNSFLFIPKEIQHLINQLQLSQTDLFTKETGLMNQLVKNESKLQLDLKDEQLELAFFYKKLSQKGGNGNNNKEDRYYTDNNRNTIKRLKTLSFLLSLSLFWNILEYFGIFWIIYIFSGFSISLFINLIYILDQRIKNEPLEKKEEN